MNVVRLIIVLFYFIFLSHAIFANDTDIIDHHVICSLVKSPINKKEQKKIQHQIHKATHKIIQEFDKKYKQKSEKYHNHYTRKKDNVFFVHYDHSFSTWTLFKPSYIDYDSFVRYIKKIYRQYGLKITCHKDCKVHITKMDLGFDNNYLTLDEFEQYQQQSLQELSSKIAQLQNNNNQSFFHDSSDQLHELQKIEAMKKLFFWHWKIPTTGLLPADEFDIDDSYKPLAWHFLLWDLAPKKGEGAHVAIIDTGSSAFNIQEEQYSQMYKKNINITMPQEIQTYGCNLVSDNGLDPLRQIVINFAHYCDHEKFDSNELLEKIQELIINTIKNKNNFQIRNYLVKNAKKQYLNEDQSDLNENGEQVLKDLLYGQYGITPQDQDPFFHIVHLGDPYNQEVLLEALPAPKIIGNKDPFAAGHGTFGQGVINAQLYHDRGIFGLAPKAHITMIKAFNDSGVTNKTTLNAALERAINLKNPIVNMSLKITDTIDKVTDRHLKELIDSIDYVVAASGNDGDSKELANKEAYPARFDSVAFDVGAFAYDNGNYSICPFTQKQLGIGPKCAAPGFDIFSCGITPHQKADSMYVFMAGTSIAVPVVTGFLALALAEFQDIFTREQILKVIYKFSIKLNNSDDWQKYITVGTPDMRSCLLCLHVLKQLKINLEENGIYRFDQNFDNLVQAIFLINYNKTLLCETLIGKSFINNFTEFIQTTKQIDKSNLEQDLFVPESKNLNECVDFIVQLITKVIMTQKKDFENLDKSKNNLKLSEDLKSVIFNKKYFLFNDLPTASKNRIKGALAPRISCIVQDI